MCMGFLHCFTIQHAYRSLHYCNVNQHDQVSEFFFSIPRFCTKIIQKSFLNMQINFNNQVNYKIGIKKSFLDDTWNTFYNNNEYISINKSQIIKNQTGNYFIHDALFFNFNSRIIELIGEQKVLIYKTIFDSNPINTRDDYYGNVINKINGSLVQFHVFSRNTTIINNKYSAVHSNAQLNEASLNYVQDSTFSGSLGYGPSIRCKSGHILIKNINISNTISDDQFSGYVASSYADFNSVSYSLFSNITSNNNNGCIRHSSFTGNICYTIFNKIKVTNSYFQYKQYCIFSIYLSSRVTISNCIIKNNAGYRLFETDWNYKVTLIYCDIQSNQVQQPTSGYIVITESSSPMINISQFGSDIEDYKSLYLVQLKHIYVNNNPVIKDIDKNFTVVIEYENNISYPASVRLYLDNEVFHEEPLQLSSKTSIFNINFTTLRLRETKVYNLSATLIGYNRYESQPISCEFQYIDPVNISVINSYVSRRGITLNGIIALKENEQVNELQIELDNSSEIVRLNNFAMDSDKIQQFTFNLNLPSSIKKGNHSIYMNAFNKLNRKIGNKTYDFNYNPDYYATSQMKFYRYRRR